MICVIAKLSPDAAEVLRSLRRAVIPDSSSVSPLYGHITIATYLPEKDEEFIQGCVKMIRGTPSFSVRYEKLEVLPETSIVVATPSRPDALLSLHSRIRDEYGKSLDRWTRGADWYPHTTLICDPAADLNAVRDKMLLHFVPFEAQIGRIELSKVEETGYSILAGVDLQ